jgi:hypothetical protein
MGRQFLGHYLHKLDNMPERQPEYIDLATTREYNGDDRRVAARFNDRLAWKWADKDLTHAGEEVYGFLESIGARMIPHGSQGTVDCSSLLRGEIARGEGELDRGAFFDHLVGNEQCLREWQKMMGSEVITDAACLGGLFHSLYGTQGYQASRFPVEKRGLVAALIGERAERLVYWNCAMERPTWRAMLMANQGLQQGQTPVGHFSGRRTAWGQEFPGTWPRDGPHRLRGDERWEMTAQDFTDFCAMQLSHVLGQANDGHGYGYACTAGDETFRVMAEHVGGAAMVQYEQELAKMPKAKL